VPVWRPGEPLQVLADHPEGWRYSGQPPRRPAQRCPHCGAEAPLPSNIVVEVVARPSIEWDSQENDSILRLGLWDWLGIVVILLGVLWVVRGIVLDLYKYG